MTNRHDDAGKLSRRSLLKAGIAGCCSLCLAAAYGCAPGENDAHKNMPELSREGIFRKGLIRTKPSPWYTKLEHGMIRCDLCPGQCLLQDGERAYCRARENRGGVCYSLTYGNPALVQEDPVERKPFFHVLPGSRALSISTAGCNLACKFCEVWDMALVEPEEVYAYDMPPETVIENARKSGVQAISYAFGEPVVYYEYMAAVAALAREKGLLNLMHTALYLQEEPLREIIKVMDGVNVDLKGFSPEFYREYVGGELEPVLENLKIIREAGLHLEITNIVIPTVNDNMDEIEDMCRWISSRLGPDTPLHFARFYPLYKLSALPRTPVSTLEKARQTALKAGLRYVYVAKVTGHEGENTYCSECGNMVIDRMGFVIKELRLEDGICPYCGTEIPGRWSGCVGGGSF